jgi:capsular polysaccharide export protein
VIRRLIPAATLKLGFDKAVMRPSFFGWRFRRHASKSTIYVFGFSRWKTFIRDWFPNYRVILAPADLTAADFEANWQARILADPAAEVLSWQYKGPPQIKAFCSAHGVPFRYVEDGFIRSVQLGALHVPPLSLAFDHQDMYFVADSPTDLEHLLSTYDFDRDVELMSRARAAIQLILQTGLSKYNPHFKADDLHPYGPKRGRRILVIGQVEQDASIVYGCKALMRNDELVRLAKRENPDAEIIYRPHPEVLKKLFPAASSFEEIRTSASIVEREMSLSTSFQTVDHVYTITSLAGFEALLRGIGVTTVGCPFYSGWGLTDDRQSNARRIRKLTVEQVFAAAYILYPTYFDPRSRSFIELEDALELLAEWRTTEIPGRKLLQWRRERR